MNTIKIVTHFFIAKYTGQQIKKIVSVVNMQLINFFCVYEVRKGT